MHDGIVLPAAQRAWRIEQAVELGAEALAIRAVRGRDSTYLFFADVELIRWAFGQFSPDAQSDFGIDVDPLGYVARRDTKSSEPNGRRGRIAPVWILSKNGIHHVLEGAQALRQLVAVGACVVAKAGIARHKLVATDVLLRLVHVCFQRRRRVFLLSEYFFVVFTGKKSYKCYRRPPPTTTFRPPP